MKVEDLWIGDTIRIRSSLKVGTYEGLSKDGRIRVKHHGKILLVQRDNIESYHFPEAPRTIDLHTLSSVAENLVAKKAKFENVIDLHIETLNPTLENEAPQIILNHQIVKCKEFIEEAIKLKVRIFTIIHGKGKGQLKLEVDFLLTHYPEVNYHIPKHNGGATEVWLNS